MVYRKERNMSKKCVKPQLRFAGFEEDWEWRKLEEVCDSFEYGLNAPAKKFDGENKYIRITDIDDSTRVFLNTDLSSPDCDLSKAENYRLQNGDIVFARTGASVGKAFIYKASDGLVYYAGFLIRAKISKNTYPDFVFYNTFTKQYEKFIRITSQRSGQPGVNAQEYATFEFSLPSYEEQNKIGNYFKNLDKLITLHQQKYNKLVNIKQFMLEKMFPKNGSNVPEIRFKGFSDAWEQCKVSEMFKVTRGYVLAATITEENKSDEMPYPVYSSQTKANGLMGYYKDYLYEDAITWTTDGANAGTVNYRAGKFYCTNVCGVLLSDNVKANQMIAEALNKVAKGYVSYVGNPKLMNNVMADIKINVPISTAEQEKIGKLFSFIDHLITLHQRKVEKLQNMKKACLEKMFV